MNRWAHRLDFKPRLDTPPYLVAQALAELLETLPPDFRAKQHDGESLDDLIRFLREDAERGCVIEEVDAWLDKVYEWGNVHRLFLNVSWRASA